MHAILSACFPHPCAHSVLVIDDLRVAMDGGTGPPAASPSARSDVAASPRSGRGRLTCFIQQRDEWR
jgi:hypothetical protein